MKKIILVSFLFLGLQNYAQKTFQFGPIISVNTAMPVTDNYLNTGSGTDMSYGAFARFNILLFYGQAELCYGTTKFTIENPEFKLSGVNTNLIAGVRILPLGKIGNLRLLAGYHYSDYSDKSSNPGIPNLNLITNSNSSIIAGAGVDFWKLTFDARYLFGMTDVDTTSNEIKVNSLNLCLGFKF